MGCLVRTADAVKAARGVVRAAEAMEEAEAVAVEANQSLRVANASKEEALGVAIIAGRKLFKRSIDRRHR